MVNADHIDARHHGAFGASPERSGSDLLEERPYMQSERKEQDRSTSPSAESGPGRGCWWTQTGRVVWDCQDGLPPHPPEVNRPDWQSDMAVLSHRECLGYGKTLNVELRPSSGPLNPYSSDLRGGSVRIL